MTFMLSQASEEHLKGIDPRLERCVRRAIATTSVDFVVFEGLRSLERQQELFRNGASRTLDSYHLTGHAVDLVPFLGGRAQWQQPLCNQVAIAMREAAVAFDVPLTWGAVWDKPLRSLDPTRMQTEIENYIERYRVSHPPIRTQGEVHAPHPLIDGPHFQVAR
jgi:peptidoglycan L-alanyl-D-glutamate endopeptidase CwlK